MLGGALSRNFHSNLTVGCASLATGRRAKGTLFKEREAGGEAAERWRRLSNGLLSALEESLCLAQSRLVASSRKGNASIDGEGAVGTPASALLQEFIGSASPPLQRKALAGDALTVVKSLARLAERGTFRSVLEGGLGGLRQYRQLERTPVRASSAGMRMCLFCRVFFCESRHHAPVKAPNSLCPGRPWSG